MQVCHPQFRMVSNNANSVPASRLKAHRSTGPYLWSSDTPSGTNQTAVFDSYMASLFEHYFNPDPSWYALLLTACGLVVESLCATRHATALNCNSSMTTAMQPPNSYRAIFWEIQLDKTLEGVQKRWLDCCRWLSGHRPTCWVVIHRKFVRVNSFW